MQSGDPAESTATALLVAIVVGSGIMAERLAGRDAAVALLANTLATGAGLAALLCAFGPAVAPRRSSCSGGVEPDPTRAPGR